MIELIKLYHLWKERGSVIWYPYRPGDTIIYSNKIKLFLAIFLSWSLSVPQMESSSPFSRWNNWDIDCKLSVKNCPKCYQQSQEQDLRLVGSSLCMEQKARLALQGPLSESAKKLGNFFGMHFGEALCSPSSQPQFCYCSQREQSSRLWIFKETLTLVHCICSSTYY